MNIWNHVKGYLPIISAVAVAGCVYASVKGYVPPVYEILTPETVQAADETRPEFAKPEEKAVVIGQGDFDLEDGTYEGQGVGYLGTVRVAVEIKDHSMVNIEILSNEDDAAYFTMAKGVISKMLETQSYDVDVMSGATYSSRGIMKAVRNAITGEVDTSEPAGLEASVGEGSTSVETVEEAGSYKDGTYYGTATGFSGPLTVEVVVENGQIVSISITSTEDGDSYISTARGVISAIISGQTTNVDTMSGATYSSVGIINAVRAALSDAASDGSGTEAESEKDEEPIVARTVPYPDGTYYGIAEGYLGDVTMAVTIRDHTITEIRVVSDEDDPAFFNRAMALIPLMMKQQNTDVDVVTGATYSSRGIIDGVKKALEQAKLAAEGKTPEEKPEAGRFPYPNGFYYGSAEGYEGPVDLTIVVRDKTLKAVVLTDSADDRELTKKARLGITPKMLMKQTVEVDTVSGATETSKAIIEAVKAAVKEAEAAGKKPEEPADLPLPGDGVYEISVSCLPDEDEDFEAYQLSMKITISQGKITDISDISGDGDPDNDSYIRRAAQGTSSVTGLVPQILQTGSADGVDTVSRATCSSNAIIEACRQALSQAAAAAEEEGQE